MVRRKKARASHEVRSNPGENCIDIVGSWKWFLPWDRCKTDAAAARVSYLARRSLGYDRNKGTSFCQGEGARSIIAGAATRTDSSQLSGESTIGGQEGKTRIPGDVIVEPRKTGPPAWIEPWKWEVACRVGYIQGDNADNQPQWPAINQLRGDGVELPGRRRERRPMFIRRRGGNRR